jgi:hypothetical protein
MEEKKVNIEIYNLSADDVMDIRAMIENGTAKEEVLDTYLSKGFNAERVHFYVNDMERIVNKNKQIAKNDLGASGLQVIFAIGIPLVIIFCILLFNHNHFIRVAGYLLLSFLVSLFLYRIYIYYGKTTN